jgi:hypothetical protein
VANARAEPAPVRAARRLAGAFLAQRLFRHKTRKLVSCCHSGASCCCTGHFWLDHLGGGFLFAALARQLGG